MEPRAPGTGGAHRHDGANGDTAAAIERPSIRNAHAGINRAARRHRSGCRPNAAGQSAAALIARRHDTQKGRRSDGAGRGHLLASERP